MAPEFAQIQVLGVPLPRYTPMTITDPRQLATELRRVRERGWLITDNEADSGTVSVNAPIRDSSGQVSASVAIVLVPCGPVIVTVAPGIARP